MVRQLPACALILALVNALPAAAAAPDIVRLLPPNAAMRVTKEADLTGDGRPELVVQAAGGGAWGILRVFSRAKDAYESLLLDAAQDHVLWDADGDGVQEVIARYRTGSQSDQVLQRFIWRNGRFVAWHAQAWSHVNGPTSGEALPGLTGLTLQQAHQSVSKAGLNLGVIAVLDAPGPGGRVVRNRLCDGQVDLAVSAGDTRLTAPPLPQVASAHYRSGTEPGTAPVAMTEVHRDRWRQWLQHLAAGAQQVVYTGTLSKAGGR